MSTENTPSVTISFCGGAWQWDDGTATCHGHESAAEAAADWQRDSEWRAARATAGTRQAPRASAADCRAVASLVAAAHGRPDPRWL